MIILLGGLTVNMLFYIFLLFTCKKQIYNLYSTYRVTIKAAGLKLVPYMVHLGRYI